MKVYIVTSGEDYDFSIERVFSSREKAEDFVRSRNSLSPNACHYNEQIDAYDVDLVDDMPDGGWPVAGIYLSRDKTIEHIEFAAVEDKRASEPYHNIGHYGFRFGGGIGNRYLYVRRPWRKADKERLIEVALEILGKMIALRNWDE